MSSLQISADRIVPAVVALVIATICLASGVRGLRGHAVWVPSDMDDAHASTKPDYGMTFSGRSARWAGLALVVLGLAALGYAVRTLWR